MGAFIYWVPVPPTITDIGEVDDGFDGGTVDVGELDGINVSTDGGLELTAGAQPGSSILWFDVTKEESHPLDNDITEHPVEQGPDITDHIRAQVDHVTIHVFVSNEPIVTKAQVAASLPRQAVNLYGAQDGGVGPLTLQYPTPPIIPNLSNAVGLIVGALTSGQGNGGIPGQTTNIVNTLQFNSEFDQVVEAYEQLKDLRDNGTIVEVVTSVRSYESMVVKSVILERTRATGNGAEITIEFRQVNIVQTSTVPAPTEVAATPKVDKGSKGSKPATPQQRISHLAKATNATGISTSGTGVTPGL